MTINSFTRLLFVFASLFVFGCQPDIRKDSLRTPIPLSDSASLETHITTPSASRQIAFISFTPTSETISTLTPKATPTSITFDLISPFENIQINQLPEILSNPFALPSPGQDDGHHGVDFSYYHFGAYASIEHQPIVSVLPGVVSAVINNRPPYGNAIIVETNWQLLSPFIKTKIGEPKFPELISYSAYINCPQINPQLILSNDNTKSMYVLYAHMESNPTFMVGDLVTQGQQLGNVGNTGMSGNPHLHLETRVGPAHATFSSMAHYDNQSTNEEMANYCFWRLSNYFILIDPMLFFS